MSVPGQRNELQWQRRNAFADALRAAIAARGVSLEWLHGRLQERATPVSLATLSYWRSGRSQPEHAASMDAVMTLEDLLHLDKDQLRSLVPPSRRAGPMPVYSQREATVTSPVSKAFAALGFDKVDRLIDTTTHVVMTVGADGIEETVRNRTVWRARSDGDHSYPMLLSIDEPKETEPIFEPVLGCQLGRAYVSEDRLTYATEILVDGHLLTGETAVTEMLVRLPRGGQTDNCYEHTVIWRLSELLISVQFHPDKLPTSVTSYQVVDGEESSRNVELAGRTAVHVVQRGWGPGRIGIRWSFD